MRGSDVEWVSSRFPEYLGRTPGIWSNAPQRKKKTMPTAAGAPAIEYGHIYNNAAVAVTISTLDTWTDVVEDDDNLEAQAYKTAVDKTTGTVEVGEGDWRFDAFIRCEGDAATDDIRARVRVVDADGTESSPHGVRIERTDSAVADGGFEFAISGYAQNLDKGATIKVQVLNGTDTGNISVAEFDLLVEGRKTNPHRQVKTSTTAS